MYKIIIVLTILIIFPKLIFSYDKENCKHFDLDNYQEIYNNQKSDLFKNPFNDNCFLLVFDKINDDDIINLIPSSNPNIISHSLIYTDHENLLVGHINDEFTNEYFNIFNFKTKSRGMDFLKVLTLRNNLINNYSPELFFLHETYHLKPLNDKENYKIDEIHSDLFAVFIIAIKYKLNYKETENLVKNIYNFRINALDPSFQNEPNTVRYFEKIAELMLTDYYHIIEVKNFKDLKKIIENNIDLLKKTNYNKNINNIKGFLK